MSSNIDESKLLPYVSGITTIYSGKKSYSIHRHNETGLGVTIPMLTEQELEEVYNSTYQYQSHMVIEDEKKWRAKKLIRKIMSSPVESALDIGCMYGFLLTELQAQGVKRVSGVEISESAVREARKNGLDVFHGTVEQYEATNPAQFDLIVINHVLEHIVNVSAFLDSVLKLLKPNGKLIILVPHFGARTQSIFKRSWGWYQVPVHVYHYSPQALESILGDHGFKMVNRFFRGGDSLFILLTLAQAILGAGKSANPSPTLNMIIKLCSYLLRPYLFIGDEELVGVFQKR